MYIYIYICVCVCAYGTIVQVYAKYTQSYRCYRTQQKWELTTMVMPIKVQQPQLIPHLIRGATCGYGGSVIHEMLIGFLMHRMCTLDMEENAAQISTNL